MKLQLLSDMHLCFGGPDPPRTDADLVILAGDASTGTHGLFWAQDYFRGQQVLYVPGNHEFYKHNYPALLEKLRRQAEGTNVRILNQDKIKINGVTFLGLTLWTDFRLRGPGQAFWAMNAAQQRMNDYRQIRLSDRNYRRLLPQDTQRLHLEGYRWLLANLSKNKNGPVVKERQQEHSKEN